MLTEINYINRCSDNVLSSITFSYLRRGELAACCSVSSRWRVLASQDKVWERVAKRFFGDMLKAPNCRYRDYLRQHISNSNDDIVDRIQAFANGVSVGENARFRCVIGPFPLEGPRMVDNQVLEVTILGNDVLSNGDPEYYAHHAKYHQVTHLDFTENCFAVNGLREIDCDSPLDCWPYKDTASSCVEVMTSITTERSLCITGTRSYHVWATIILPYDRIFHSPIVVRIVRVIRERLDKLNTPSRSSCAIS